MTSTDGVHLHLHCYWVLYFIRDAAVMPHCRVISLPALHWDIQGLLFWCTPLSYHFSKGKTQRCIREERLCESALGSNREVWAHPTPWAPRPQSFTHPPTPRRPCGLLDGLGGASHNSLWTQLPQPIPISGVARVLSTHTINKQQNWKENLISDNCPLYLSVLKPVGWTNFHEAKVANRVFRFERRVPLDFSPQDVTSR